MASSSGKRKRKREEGDDPVVDTPSETAGEKFTFFFGAESPFSQWHSAMFSVDGVEYNCAEQYMMHQKAGKSVKLGALLLRMRM